ncbi:DNA-binding protein [Dickeya fangzhongdai]|uniref:helix-turn-helix domain-containing protein n=1 Tax=Dickeya fangzhongdai TaxID=1778540 RepID=UPI000575A9EF|nr:helix-turn-helix transcriptional regulator [Dickeya fangzhongdai]KHN52899.1 DNA-binding protein [Dickeya fangzhongdai]
MASIYSFEYQMIIKTLREARTRNGMTQENLAKSLGRPQSFVAKIENGERRLDVVEFVHIALLLSVDHIAVLEKIIIKIQKDKLK